MLPRRIYLSAILFLAYSVGTMLSTHAQDRSGPTLIGDFESFPCSELRYLADQFMAELAKEPGSSGYVVNAGSFDKLSSLVWREELIKAQMEVRNFDKSRVVFERAELDGVVRTRLWKIPSLIARPEVENINNSLSLSTHKQQFILIKQTFLNDSECPDVNYPKLFARFLDANPQARANIVVYGQTSAEISRREKTMLTAMTSTFKIRPERIRTFRRLIRNDPEHPKGIEYWYLP